MLLWPDRDLTLLETRVNWKEQFSTSFFYGIGRKTLLVSRQNVVCDILKIFYKEKGGENFIEFCLRRIGRAPHTIVYVYIYSIYIYGICICT